jgi:ParB-like chromosome segregation protein Spo0J
MPAVELAAHPVAELFPMLASDELAELAEDINQRGLLHPIVLDDEGRILDGRNRWAACLLVDVAPTFVVFDGDDPAGYALAVNLARRNLTKGQAAMIAAKARLLNKQTQREVATAHSISAAAVAFADVVLAHAPDIADLVVSGTKPLNEAYEEARKRKRDAASDEAKMAKLRASRPDLAAQVVEESLTVTAAYAGMQADEVKRADEQRDALALLTRIVDLATPPSMSGGFINSWAEHLGDVSEELINRTEQASRVLGELAERIKK